MILFPFMEKKFKFDHQQISNNNVGLCKIINWWIFVVVVAIMLMLVCIREYSYSPVEFKIVQLHNATWKFEACLRLNNNWIFCFCLILWNIISREWEWVEPCYCFVFAAKPYCICYFYSDIAQLCLYSSCIFVRRMCVPHRSVRSLHTIRRKFVQFTRWKFPVFICRQGASSLWMFTAQIEKKTTRLYWIV